MLNCFTSDDKCAIPIHIVEIAQYDNWLKQQSDVAQAWLKASNFLPAAGVYCCVPDKDGKISLVVCTVLNASSLWCIGHLPLLIPPGNYRVEASQEQTEQFAIAWGLGSYQFTRYKKPTRKPACLSLPDSLQKKAENIIDGIYLVRNWINTPTDDMGPSELASEAESVADEFHATFKQIAGDELLHENYPAIYAVGRASDDAPRLLDMRWGDPKNPKVTLVGKGVCFDTGGLDLKPADSMLLMKKDMGGAAHVFGLARMIMQAKLPISLRVLVPAVENAVSGNAYRPGDVIKSRKGLSIEIGNTDAEGRLVVADALAEAVSENPDLLIDICTLTGAARVALGAELPAVFSNSDEVVNELISIGNKINDPMWRLPLYAAYRDFLISPIADLNNCSTESGGGAITAALFLQEFVPANIKWVHFDIMAWNKRFRPGRPVGGEAMALRTLFKYLETKYAYPGSEDRAKNPKRSE